jgi:O-antigen ligase
MAEHVLERHPILKIYDHFHNSYVQVLVELGLAGAACFGLALVLSLHRLAKAYRDGALSLSLLAFLLGAWAMLLAWSLFNTRLAHVDERFHVLLLTGATYTFGLFPRRRPTVS